MSKIIPNDVFEAKRTKRMTFCTTPANWGATCNLAVATGRTTSDTLHGIVTEFHGGRNVNHVNTSGHPLIARAERLQELTRKMLADGRITFPEFIRALLYLFGFQMGLYRERQKSMRSESGFHGGEVA